MANSVLIRQARVLDPVVNCDRVTDILIVEGKIEAIETHIDSFPQEASIVQAQGLILGTGLVDLYSHSGEPGHEERETLVSLATGAAAGGFTRVSILPDTVPVIDDLSVLEALQQKSSYIQQNTLSDTASLQFWGALTVGRNGQQMTELADLAAGVIGFADSRPVENLHLLRRLLEYLQPLAKAIALVPVTPSLRGNGVMREGIDSIRYGLPGNPAISEASTLAVLIEMVAATGTPVHLMRISTRRGVELIAEAKARGIPITASTSWMHLLLSTEALGSYDPNLRLEPPLGTEADRQALVAGIKEGVINAIAIDHTPYTYEEKALAFAEAPPGVIGLELALPLLWQRFVASGEWTALTLWKALSLNPCLCLQQQPSSCAHGQPAELVLFDPQTPWTVSPATLKSRCSNTPWLGQAIQGRVVRIWNSDLG